jgi:hypothetical protein
MLDHRILEITEDFDDFLMKIVSNYEVSYSALAGIIMARMVVLAQNAGGEEVMLKLLPHMEKTLKQGMNTDGYH